MQLDINKPSDDFNKPPKLSKFGIIVVVGLICVFLAVVVFFLSSSAARKAREQKEQPVILAIERAINVCESSLAVISPQDSVMDEFNAIKLKISKATKIEDKVELSNEAIAFVLKQVIDRQSLVDELNGSRNRIFVAFKEYNQN